MIKMGEESFSTWEAKNKNKDYQNNIYEKLYEKLNIARSCMKFKGFTCENTDCLNVLCPINREFGGKKMEDKPYEKYSWICPRCKDDALILQRNSVGLYFFCLNCKLDSSNLSKDAKGKTISIYAKPDQQGYTKAYKLLTNLFYLVHIQKDKPGDYQPIENGEWDVKLDDNCGYTTKSQDHAEIISRLVKLEQKMNIIVKRIEND